MTKQQIIDILQQRYARLSPENKKTIISITKALKYAQEQLVIGDKENRHSCSEDSK